MEMANIQDSMEETKGPARQAQGNSASAAQATENP